MPFAIALIFACGSIAVKMKDEIISFKNRIYSYFCIEDENENTQTN